MQRYQLPILHDPDIMELNLKSELFEFGSVTWVNKTDSTNVDLYNLARSQTPTTRRPWLLGTHLQEKGRGRAGRTWQNKSGAHLMFSCAFDSFIAPRNLAGMAPTLGMYATMALRKLIASEHHHSLTMKWPNDIMWQGAKLAGILVEVTRAGTARMSRDHHVIIAGIGINLSDARALSDSLERRIADWSQIMETDRTASSSAPQITTSIARSWYKCIQHVASNGLQQLPEQYATFDYLVGRQVYITDNNTQTMSGIACGVNSSGALLVRTLQGMQTVHVGDVSVRPHERH